jgi:hypothetical protein
VTGAASPPALPLSYSQRGRSRAPTRRGRKRGRFRPGSRHP